MRIRPCDASNMKLENPASRGSLFLHMYINKHKFEIPEHEIEYVAIRATGPGGQNVNKVSSKVVLSFDLENSNGLNENEKTYLKEKLASR